MSKSALQIARASYVPKMPQVLNGNVQPREGAAQHVRNAHHHF